MGNSSLKQALTQAPALSFPDSEKAFQLHVHEREGIVLGVLTQRLGSEPQPVAYLSKKLNPTTRGWPHCLQNLAAIAIMREDALKLSFGGKLFLPATSKTTHGHHQMVNTEIRLIIFFAAKDGEALYSQQKQDWEMIVAQIMNSLLPNSDAN